MATKPRILFILHLPPPTHGASMVGQYIQDSDLVKSSFDGDFINLTTSRNLNGNPNSKVNTILAFLNIQKKVLGALLKNNYQLCYVTLNAKGGSFYKDLLVVSLLKLFGKKVIYHFHNKGVALWSQRALNRPIYRFAFKGAYNIQLSPLLYYDIKQYVKEDKVFFCANGIPAAPAGADAVVGSIAGAAGTARPGVCRLLFLSNMIEEKGVYVLLEACKRLKARGLDFECHFVGAWSDISETAFKEKVSASGLTGTVIAHGKKYNQDKLECYDRADVFVFPTYYHNECFPLVILEAMQFSLPVVSTIEGAIPDMVADKITGLLVPQRDAGALANELEFLILHPEIRKAMGMEGKKRFDQLYTLDQFEHNFTSILKKVIYAENH